jgi:hypothetical protein
VRKNFAFHCTDCNRDFKTKAALVAHEKLAKVHAPAKPLAPKPRIDPEAVRTLRPGAKSRNVSAQAWAAFAMRAGWTRELPTTRSQSWYGPPMANRDSTVSVTPRGKLLELKRWLVDQHQTLLDRVTAIENQIYAVERVIELCD